MELKTYILSFHNFCSAIPIFFFPNIPNALTKGWRDKNKPYTFMISFCFFKTWEYLLVFKMSFICIRNSTGVLVFQITFLLKCLLKFLRHFTTLNLRSVDCPISCWSVTFNCRQITDCEENLWASFFSLSRPATSITDQGTWSCKTVWYEVIWEECYSFILLCMVCYRMVWQNLV